MELSASLTFAAEVLEYLIKEKGLSKAELARRSNLSESTVKRACSRTHYLRPSRNSLIAMCFALELSVDEKNILLDIFFPEERAYDQLLAENYSVIAANEKLHEYGYDLLGGECEKN